MYFKKIKSYQDLKDQYRELIKKNHPDNGGSEDAMKEINVEFEALFAIWKNRRNESEQTETASTIRKTFYTQNGWAGENYTPGLRTKEISKIIRTYCKEKYPTWKFSVRTEEFAGGSAINISVMEAPVDIFDREYFKQPFYDGYSYGNVPGYRTDCWTNFDKMTTENSYHLQLHKIYRKEEEPYLNDIGYEVLHDVFNFMMSYNYDDSDGSIDYFDTNFYSSFDIGKWDKGFRIVPKTARIKNKKEEKEGGKQEMKKAAQITQTGKYTYTIKKDFDTRDHSELWVVRINESLDKEAYIAENKAMRNRGGYYSKYKHGFIFKSDPSEILIA